MYYVFLGPKGSPIAVSVVVVVVVVDVVAFLLFLPLLPVTVSKSP